MYRSRVQCIGTTLADCGLGEPVFLDLQPLSTRIELMCKLVIIIQGACLERAGPPKLVQDRCLQFDGCDKEASHAPTKAISRIKSISCETLLSDNGEYSATRAPLPAPANQPASFTGFNDIAFSDTEIKISISSSSGQFGQPARHRTQLAFSDDECLNDITSNIDLRLNRNPRGSQHLADSYDTEHYFKYRLGKASLLRDYASATYYQVVFLLLFSLPAL
jgi:hypothetical protein